VPKPEGLAGRIAGFAEAGVEGEKIAEQKLKGYKVQPAPADLERQIKSAADEASGIAKVKLVGGGELIERAVTKLSDERRRATPGGVFCLVNEMSVEIDRLTAAAKQEGGTSSTRRFTPDRQFVESGDPSLPASVVGTKGALVSALAKYEELARAFLLVVADFGPRLAQAIHGVPVGRIEATAKLVLRGQLVEKEQDRFLQEVTLLLFVEMVRAKAAWAFAIPNLIDAKTGAAVTAALNEKLFPHAQAGFVRNYQKWGPAVFDEAAEALFAKLGVEFEQRSGFRRGGEVFLDVTQIDTAVDAIKVKLDKIYDDLLSKS
jgi:hypothetical protein